LVSFEGVRDEVADDPPATDGVDRSWVVRHLVAHALERHRRRGRLGYRRRLDARRRLTSERRDVAKLPAWDAS